jgi:hypothetical protein
MNFHLFFQILTLAGASVAAEGKVATNSKGHEILTVQVVAVITDKHPEEIVVHSKLKLKSTDYKQLAITCSCGVPVGESEPKFVCPGCDRTYHDNCQIQCPSCAVNMEGLTWSAGSYQNTCPIDGYLTGAAIYANKNPHFMGLFQQGKKHMKDFADCLQNIIAGKPQEAQDKWSKIAMSKEKDKRHSKTDVFGTIEDRVIFPMVESTTFVRQESCNQTDICKRKPTYEKENIHLLPENGLPAKQNFNMMLNEGEMPLPCHYCPRGKRDTALRTRGKIEIADQRKPPPILEVTLGANYTVEEVMKDLPDYVNISGQGYRKSLMSVLRGSHFTNLIRDGTSWIQYDGMRSRGARSSKHQFR